MRGSRACEESAGVKGHSRQREQKVDDHPAHPGKTVGMESGAWGEGEQKEVGSCQARSGPSVCSRDKKSWKGLDCRALK